MTGMPDRYQGIVLALRVWRLLRAGWMTRAEVAAALDLHERTVRRLIDALRAADVEIAQRPREGTAALEYRGDKIR